MLRHACTLDPGSVLARSGLGKALLAAGRPDEASSELEHAVRLAPGHVNSQLLLGVAHREAGRAARAIKHYDALERGGLRRPELYENRAAAWLDCDEPSRALADYDCVVSHFPAYLPAHHQRARVIREYQLEGDPFEGFRRLAQAHPQDAGIWHRWALALLSFREYREVVAVTSSAPREIAALAEMTYVAAIAYSETGELQTASRLFERCRGHFGTSAPYLVALSRHLLRIGDARRAADVASSALTIDPENQLALAYQGTAWRLLGDDRHRWLNDFERHVATVRVRPPSGCADLHRMLEDVARTLRGLHRTKAQPADQTLCNGTQTAGALLDRPESDIRLLRTSLEQALRDYVGRLPEDHGHPFLRRKALALRFAGSWSVRLREGGYHINHVHPAGWVSSAFYVTAPVSGSGSGDEGALQLGQPPYELNLGLAAERIIPAEPGTLVLFPSYMWHGTIPFTCTAERMTVAFDAVPADEDRGRLTRSW